MSTIGWIKMARSGLFDTANPNMPPQWLLDKLADDVITGKYDLRPENICDKCFLARSVNSLCGCYSSTHNPRVSPKLSTK